MSRRSKNIDLKGSTFVDLYTFLQEFDNTNPNRTLQSWLEISWEGIDKQESLLRLFTALKCIDKLKQFDICKGNFNKGTISKMTELKEFFYKSDETPTSLKDKGDSSDLTCMSKNNEKHLLVTTSKSTKDIHVNKLDLSYLAMNCNSYNDSYKFTYCIVVRSTSQLENKVLNCEKSSYKVKEMIQNESTIIIDWNDLNEAFNQFKRIYANICIKQLFTNFKTPLLFKFHQVLSTQKTLKLKKENEKRVLWGHIQRSGKSYIMASTIMEDSKNKNNCNYLIITTAPNETILQYINVFNCLQLSNFNIIHLNSSSLNNVKKMAEKKEEKSKNIIICSKQFLQTKVKAKQEITWLKNTNIDIRFVDESHFGGSTELAQSILNYYSPSSFTVLITATYLKPVKEFNIPYRNCILWDLEDIKCCKTIKDTESKRILIQKHSSDLELLLNQYSLDNIIKEYSSYPELWILTDEIKEEIKNEIVSENNPFFGWSPDACFLLNQTTKVDSKKEKNTPPQFQNIEENCKLWWRIFGKRNKFGIPDKDYPENKVFMKRIEAICKNPFIQSRYIGNMEGEPLVIMAFLPQNDIDSISNATKSLLLKYNILSEKDYEIVIINSEAVGSKSKETIKDATIKAKNEEKKAVLVLTGKQCSLGVTIENCDVVLLLNNNTSFDFIYQSMFRCMTEGRNKKCGFVVDLNLNRVIDTCLVDYSNIIRPNDHPKKAIEYVLKSRLITINGDDWLPMFKTNLQSIEDINKDNMICSEKMDLSIQNFSNSVYTIYSSNTEKALSHLLNKLNFKIIKLTDEEETIIKSIFNKKILNETIKNDINDGIEKVEVKKEESTSDEDDEKEEKESEKKEEKEEVESKKEEKEEKEENKSTNYIQLLKYMIPLICILTINNNETTLSKMFESLEKDQYLMNIFLEQIKGCWNENIDLNDLKTFLKQFINIYNNNMSVPKEEINQIVITIKELFVKSKNNYNELSSLIDTYLIPLKSEKQDNAEVSTPYNLRQEMMKKIPIEFWTNPNHKVFECCSGKGGFLIDIVNAFNNGLKKSIPDDKKRFKHIVENCIYFSDINATNIYICKLLLSGVDGKFKLNYNEGDTLLLNCKEKWNTTTFDAVIGNPPYNANGSNNTGNTIWQHFTKKAITEWLKKDGYLLFVHPPGWRKPATAKSKFNGLYKLMTQDCKMLYLNINNAKHGMATFKCGTRYDWYLLQNSKNSDKLLTTIVDDENKDEEIKIDTTKYEWLPNSNFKYFENLITNDPSKRLKILCDFSYSRLDKKIMNKTKDKTFKYEIIYLTPKSGVRYMYSNTNKNGHFGIKKVIIGETGMDNAINDCEGKYGMTQDSFGIIIENKKQGDDILKFLKTNEFVNFIKKSCSWSNFRIDWRMFTYFKNDFYK